MSDEWLIGGGGGAGAIILHPEKVGLDAKATGH